MWIAVTNRFATFNANLQLTPDQEVDGETKHKGVRACLNRSYYGVTSETDNSFLIGSWAKGTRVRPPRDVDLYFVLTYADYLRFENYSGNKQSALLQEVKGVLQSTYPATDMSGDGQVVVVRFNTVNVEVVPVFLLNNGRYYVPNTHNGGHYMVSDPDAELARITSADMTTNSNVRRLVQMLKAWQRECSVAIKSFHLELLVAEFLEQSPWGTYSYFYYDWLSRDFFEFLIKRANTYLCAPGTLELMHLGDAWKSRCESAHGRAVRACEYEYADRVIAAREEWQKIFGNQIPVTP